MSSKDRQTKQQWMLLNRQEYVYMFIWNISLCVYLHMDTYIGMIPVHGSTKCSVFPFPVSCTSRCCNHVVNIYLLALLLLLFLFTVINPPYRLHNSTHCYFLFTCSSFLMSSTTPTTNVATTSFLRSLQQSQTQGDLMDYILLAIAGVLLCVVIMGMGCGPNVVSEDHDYRYQQEEESTASSYIRVVTETYCAPHSAESFDSRTQTTSRHDLSEKKKQAYLAQINMTILNDAINDKDVKKTSRVCMTTETLHIAWGRSVTYNNPALNCLDDLKVLERLDVKIRSFSSLVFVTIHLHLLRDMTRGRMPEDRSSPKAEKGGGGCRHK